MNCISWNCRGLRNPQRVRELSDLVRAKDPNLVFLMETKKKKILCGKTDVQIEV